ASLTGLPNNHRDFDLPMPDVIHVSCPHYWRNSRQGETEQEFTRRLADELEARILAEGPETVAAFFGEPIMGAGGVIVPPEGYWQDVRRVCTLSDILLVADAVISGFRRPGRMFGSEVFGIDPDLMVLSKHLTSFYLPLAAIVFADNV